MRPPAALAPGLPAVGRPMTEDAIERDAEEAEDYLDDAVAAVVALPNGIRHPKKRAFLAAYARCGNLSEAARQAGVSRLSHYDWLARDERYAEVFAQAEEIAGDYLEAVARHRATRGWLEPVYYQGKKVGSVRRFSDTLLIFLIKGARPEKYRENATIRHTGPAGGAIQVAGDYELSQRLMSDPAALAAAEALAAALLEDHTAGELGPAPIPVESQETTE